MGKTYTIRLNDHDWGQVLDGLRCRSDAWHNTARCLEPDNDSGDGILIEECRDAEEARAIANHYDQIIASIEKQMLAQKNPT